MVSSQWDGLGDDIHCVEHEGVCWYRTQNAGCEALVKPGNAALSPQFLHALHQSERQA